MSTEVLSRETPVFVAGHRGLVGSAILRRLEKDGFKRLVTAGRDELDLRDGPAVARFLRRERVGYVVLAAARVGGIHANASRPAEFIYDNLAIETAVIHEAWKAGVDRLLLLGSSCIYPREAPQPIPESALLSGPLERTNAPYAVAKIAGIALCEAYNRQYGAHYRCIMPTNLYGPNDNFDLEQSHVIPGLMHRMHQAKVEGAESVEVWGSGCPRREFLHVDDLADACVFVMGLEDKVFEEAVGAGRCHLNVGAGEDLTVRELAELIREVVGYKGNLRFNQGKPDGTPRKLLDTARLTALGWHPRIGLKEGLAKTYAWFLSHEAEKNRTPA